MQHLLLALLLASSADLTVVVSGISEPKGDVRCALFRSEESFPMNGPNAAKKQQPAKAEHVEFLFENLTPGKYAIAVGVDWNRNQKIDKNFLGMPTEPWGVSNNVRHRTRAPKFDEAAFEVREGGPNRIEIKVAK